MINSTRPISTWTFGFLALAAIGLALPVVVHAQMGPGTGGMAPGGGMGPGGMGPGGGRMMPSFADFDGDGDGQITQTEFEQARAQRIAERSREGYRMRGLANAPTFADMDANGDGVLNQDEFTAGVASHHQPPQR